MRNIRSISPHALIILSSLFCLLALNSLFLTRLPELTGGDSGVTAFAVAICFAIFALLNITTGLVAIGRGTKLVIILFVVIAAVSNYFMKTYSVLINMEMIRNTFETTWEESNQYFNGSMLTAIALQGLLPALLIWFVPLSVAERRVAFRKRVLFIGMNVVLLLAALLPFSQQTIMLFRNHREVRFMVNPLSSLYATVRYARSLMPHHEHPFVEFPLKSASTVLGAPQGKKLLSLFVVGETARADHFSLNGYQRKTNPELETLDLINFPDTTSCDTDTATSMPCLFSHLGREQFSVAAARRFDNALDILAKSGFATYWIDNNTGCKGICARITEISLVPTESLCNSGGCHDEIFLPAMDQLLGEKPAADTFIVMHQLGSHGPAYYLRYPERFRRFTPTCDTSSLQDCTDEELRNSYDNTILYTDFFLAEIIRKLQTLEATYDTALIYVSDHGESLGEHNIYLHGLPYFIAPKEQKHVPFIAWLSPGLQRRLGIDSSCLRTRSTLPHSHDNIFHSLLGLYGIDVSPYNQALDIFAGCRVAGGSAKAE